jgi:5'-nucleotidase/UDP-sugar diphosphatase
VVQTGKYHPQKLLVRRGSGRKTATKVAFASRGYSIDQKLAIAPQDIPNTFTDIGASTLLANLCTDAYRRATKADIGFSVNGMMRSSLIRGKSGVQTVYDVFAVAPLGAGVVDTTAGSTLVTGYFTGQELKNMLEFFLVDNPAHPGEYFPRASGMRFRYDASRPSRRGDRHRIGRSRPWVQRDRHQREGCAVA